VVQFNADIADGMQWKFVPAQREVIITYLLAPYKENTALHHKEDLFTYI